MNGEPKTVRIAPTLAGHLLDMLRVRIQRMGEKLVAASTENEKNVIKLQLEMLEQDCKELANAMQLATIREDATE